LSGEDSLLATGSYDRTVSLWDLKSAGREPIQILADFRDSVTSVAHTEQSVVVGSMDGSLHVYDLRKGLCHCDDLGDPPTALRVSSDRRSVLACCLGSPLSAAAPEGSLRLMELESGRELGVYSGGHTHRQHKTEACFLPDDQHVLAGSEDATVCHYALLSSVGGESVARQTPTGHARPVSSLCAHPTQAMYVTASYDGTARVWTSPPYR
jgi:mitogen-activated protein kinase organizer 1